MRFRSKPGREFLFWLFLGGLYILAGFATFQNPLLAAGLLTLLLGASLVVSGIVRIILAFSMKDGAPWIWVIISGVVALILGLMILARWPVSSLYALGIFLGIDLVIAGASWISIGAGFGKRA